AGSVAGRMAVRMLKLFQELVSERAEVMQRDIEDALVLTGAGQGDGELMRLPFDQNPVPVDPSARDEVHVVVEDKNSACLYQVEITQVRKRIGLHDRDGIRMKRPLPAGRGGIRHGSTDPRLR